MDIASIIGLVLCLGMMLLGIITSGGIQTIGNFIDVPSAAITFGGAFVRFWHPIQLLPSLQALRASP